MQTRAWHAGEPRCQRTVRSGAERGSALREEAATSWAVGGLLNAALYVRWETEAVRDRKGALWGARTAESFAGTL
ncbi:hypothetical protein NDU88_002444 [Pleurodeles waltl]|uniref:Uncharacterized protein n=1 Tax=Pleurodeles waltl TaxID=8319 RepID=A0AAV7TN92_PLEWA|nr:hypothetical protein NDU88_002444 [Pleurodeles waltl]